jgi:hypothetical protein
MITEKLFKLIKIKLMKMEISIMLIPICISSSLIFIGTIKRIGTGDLI